MLNISTSLSGSGGVSSGTANGSNGSSSETGNGTGSSTNENGYGNENGNGMANGNGAVSSFNPRIVDEPILLDKFVGYVLKEDGNYAAL